MTVLGKILAILNLVLSVAVAAFIIMTYVARTNWNAAYEAQKTRATAAQASADAYRAEVEKLQGELNNARTEVASAKAQVAEAKANAAAAAKIHQDNLAKEKVTTRGLMDENKALKDGTAKLQEEVNQIRGQLAQREERIAKMQKEVQDSRDSEVEALIALKAEQARNERLLSENERLVSENQRLQQSRGTVLASGNGESRRNPPREDVEGLVKSTDPSGYLTLSIGSDAGLSRGNTLEVYRLKPDPKYLGTIQILSVRPDQAVAKPITKPNGVIQVGDRVSKDVMSHK
jgi:hypothetical protein